MNADDISKEQLSQMKPFNKCDNVKCYNEAVLEHTGIDVKLCLDCAEKFNKSNNFIYIDKQKEKVREYKKWL